MRPAATVGITLVGLLVVSNGIGYLAWPVSVLQQRGTPAAPPVWPTALLVLAPAVLVTAFGGWLVCRRHRLAAAWFSDEPTSLQAEPRALLQVGLVLIGVWLASWSLPTLAGGLAWVMAGDQPRMPWPSQLAVPFVQLVLAFLLVGGSRAIAGWAWREPAS